MESYESIRARYLKLTKVWHPDRQTMPVHKVPQHDGSSHVEVAGSGTFALVGTERGSETARQETRSLDELLYWIARGEAEGRGLDYELAHRQGTDDFRRVYFAKAVSELALVSEEWAIRLKNEFDAILGEHPYRDDPFNERVAAGA